MKQLTFKLTTLVIALVLFSSCSSDDNESEDNQVTEPFFVEINGTDFNEITINAARVASNTIAIEAIDAQGINVVLGFTGDLSAGTVFSAGFGNGSTNFFVPVYDTDGGGFVALSGSLTLLSHDENAKTMTGRFSFSGPDSNNNSATLNFTDGEFMVTYTTP